MLPHLAAATRRYGGAGWLAKDRKRGFEGGGSLKLRGTSPAAVGFLLVSFHSILANILDNGRQSVSLAVSQAVLQSVLQSSLSQSYNQSGNGSQAVTASDEHYEQQH